MSYSITPTTIKPPQPVEDKDIRIGQLISHSFLDNHRYAIVGFPSDEGVKRNKGRVGAKDAPEIIREHLYKLTPDSSLVNGVDIWKKVVDFGNLILKNEIADDQNNLGSFVSEFLDRSLIPIILGGGHETSFGHFAGYLKSRRPVHVINFDAHLDVRQYSEGPHSGSPFRQMIEMGAGFCKRYDVFGIQPHSSASHHLDFVAENGSYHFRDNVAQWPIEKLITADNHDIMLTIDLDLFDQSIMPGVSAPAVNGLYLKELLPHLKTILKTGRVTSIDIVELNPHFDRDSQSAKLAAWLIYWIVNQLSIRS